MRSPELIVCSHRGPFVFERTADRLVAKRGGGGLIGAVEPVLERLGGTWIAAALSDGDREFAARDPKGREQSGFTLRLLDLPVELHEQHYGTVSNEHLWFLFHYLFDIASQPAFDDSFKKSWDGYVAVNDRYARAIIDSGRSDAVLVQDYHLMLVGSLLRGRSRVRRPILYFHHTPWCEPDYFSLLPGALIEQILGAMLDYDVVGFHARRWADAFIACCLRFLKGARVSRDRITWKRRATRVVVAPVPLDTSRLTTQAADPRTTHWSEHHDEVRAGRKLLLRVDRIDLSKNPLRGFLAFEQLLERKPKLAEEVLFLAMLYPSRLSIERYQKYYAECTGVVRRINDRFGADLEDGPILLHFEDDYYRSLGAMRVYDTLLVNPVFDGLNLVAKEGAFVNDRNGVIVLSQNAGAFEEMGDATIPLNPFDVTATADAIQEALKMPKTQRAKLSAQARRAAGLSTPDAWARTQLKAAGL